MAKVRDLEQRAMSRSAGQARELAEVELGGYLASVRLTDHGSLVLWITGADFTPKLFRHLIDSKPRLNLVEFVPERK